MASPEYEVGDVHDDQVAESRLHSKVDPVSVDEKVNVADPELTVPLGPESIDVSGGVVSPLSMVATMLSATSA